MTTRTVFQRFACPFCREAVLEPKHVLPSVEAPGFLMATYGAIGGSSQVEVTITVEDPNKLADRFIYARFMHTCPELILR